MKFFRWIWDEIFGEKPSDFFGTLFWAFFMWIIIGTVVVATIFLAPM